MNNMKLYITRVIGEAVKGWVRVNVDIDIFNAIKQSVFARRNKQTPLLQFSTTRDAEGNYVSLFNFQGVELVNIYNAQALQRNTFFMKEEQAATVLADKKEVLPFKLSEFDLRVQAVV